MKISSIAATVLTASALLLSVNAHAFNFGPPSGLSQASLTGGGLPPAVQTAVNNAVNAGNQPSGNVAPSTAPVVPGTPAAPAATFVIPPALAALLNTAVGVQIVPPTGIVATKTGAIGSTL